MLSARTAVAAAIGVVTLAISACSSSSNPKPPGATPAHSSSVAEFTVASTLDGHTTLPQRFRWQANPHEPAGQVQEVDFLIDGRLVWVEHSAPYIFGGDDNGANRGYLTTTWLSPGTHAFTARALDVNGHTVSNTINARVQPAHQPPAALRGIWTRVITGGGPLAGRWELAFDNVGVWELDPNGSGLANELSVRNHTLTIGAPIQIAPFANGETTTSAYGHHSLGGTDCTPAGCPCQNYRWSRSGDQLTVVVLHCPQRAQVVENGVWTRAPHQIPANLKP